MKIKSSGETVEVNEQIMKILRAEEKKLYREFETMSHFNSDDPGKKKKHPFSANVIKLRKDRISLL